MENAVKFQEISSVLPLAADVAHAAATVYIPDTAVNGLTVLASAKPNTSLILYKPRIFPMTVCANEEPLIWRTLKSGKCIEGQREWAVNMDALDMKTCPIRGEMGDVIAVVSFETSMEEASLNGHNTLQETAYMLLTNGETKEDISLYRPMTTRDGILIADGNGLIIYANSAALSIFKILGIGNIVNRGIYERQVNLNLAQNALTAGVPMEKEVCISDVVLMQRAIPIVYAGRTMRVVIIVTDVTERKQKEKELLIKSAVIKEIHHRVKNNLQTIASLLRLQARRASSQEVKEALKESVNRILSISTVHEFLSQQDDEFIDVSVVVKNIFELVVKNMVDTSFNIKTVYNQTSMLLPSDQATTLALVINELVQNAIEHGFIGRNAGTISIDVNFHNNEYCIVVHDDGNGLPKEFSLKKAQSLGLQIVHTLAVDDLGGTFELYSRGLGTYGVIVFPRREEFFYAGT